MDSGAPPGATNPFEGHRPVGRTQAQFDAQQGNLDHAAAPDTAAFVNPNVAFDGGDEKTFSTDSPFEVPDSDKLPPDSGSVAFRLLPGWDKGNQDDADFFQLGENGFHLFKNVNFLRFEFLDGSGAEVGTGTNIGEWTPDEPHLITATWGGGRLFLYVDGKLVGEKPYERPPDIKPGTAALIGSAFPEGRPVAPGVLTNVQVYKAPLGAGEVANLAAQFAAPNASAN